MLPKPLLIATSIMLFIRLCLSSFCVTLCLLAIERLRWYTQAIWTFFSNLYDIVGCNEADESVVATQIIVASVTYQKGSFLLVYHLTSLIMQFLVLCLLLFIRMTVLLGML